METSVCRAFRTSAIRRAAATIVTLVALPSLHSGLAAEMTDVAASRMSELIECRLLTDGGTPADRWVRGECMQFRWFAPEGTVIDTARPDAVTAEMELATPLGENRFIESGTGLMVAAPPRGDDAPSEPAEPWCR